MANAAISRAQDAESVLHRLGIGRMEYPMTEIDAPGQRGQRRLDDRIGDEPYLLLPIAGHNRIPGTDPVVHGIEQVGESPRIS